MSLPDLGGADEEAVLYGLANLPDDRAADLIGDWIETRDDHRDDAIRALVLQGSARAAQILQGLLPSIEDDNSTTPPMRSTLLRTTSIARRDTLCLQEPP